VFQDALRQQSGCFGAIGWGAVDKAEVRRLSGGGGGGSNGGGGVDVGGVVRW
jgi:hypothetical protein